MKKILILPIFVITLLFVIAPFIKNDNIENFPNGKNYVNPDNMYIEGNFIFNKEPILIKPNTTYTISISRYYVDGGPFEFIFDFYADETLTKRLNEDDGTMDFDIPTNTYYFTFNTQSNTNYLDFYFSNNAGLSEIGDLEDIQIEEGDVFTDFEPYKAKMFFGSMDFFIILIIILTITISMVSVFYYNKYRDKRTVINTKKGQNNKLRRK
ncbi:MAG: hypothetical protein RBQ64_07270 [Candidatus Izemoplasmatales bacterium]|jgi:hypothetical protein|nr:hypothetical protein [Candidatus Izemoplasmatales bacterium]